jgi:hypothetical protein
MTTTNVFRRGLGLPLPFVDSISHQINIFGDGFGAEGLTCKKKFDTI